MLANTPRPKGVSHVRLHLMEWVLKHDFGTHIVSYLNLVSKLKCDTGIHMEKPSCSKCRFWESATCHAWPPSTGVWPATKADDWCGRFSLPAAARPESKLTDADIMEDVHEFCLSKLPMKPIKRTDLIQGLLRFGVSQTAVLNRIQRLVAKGQLKAGERADLGGGLHVWPGEKIVAEAATGPVGRPNKITTDEFLKTVGSFAAKPEEAVSIRGLVLEMGGCISVSTAHRLVTTLVTEGKMGQNENGVWVVPLEEQV